MTKQEVPRLSRSATPLGDAGMAWYLIFMKQGRPRWPCPQHGCTLARKQDSTMIKVSSNGTPPRTHRFSREARLRYYRTVPLRCLKSTFTVRRRSIETWYNERRWLRPNLPAIAYSDVGGGIICAPTSLGRNMGRCPHAVSNEGKDELLPMGGVLLDRSI